MSHIEINSPAKSGNAIQEDNIFSVIRNRRSTRSYLSKQVSVEIIHSLIDYSIQAPSAMNLQPWSFVVIQNQKLMTEICDEVKRRLFRSPDISKAAGEQGVHLINDQDFDIFYGAPTLIVICAKEKDSKEFNTDVDCFLAGENLMLAATGMGLATCPIGLATDLLNDPAMSIRLGIPKDYIAVLPIVVGYSSSKPESVDRNPPIVNWVTE